MLDVSRHYFTANEIKHMLDLSAMLKLNKFHWHLTDDHGWRLPIAGHPEIVDKGAWRDAGPEHDGNLYGGYYSELEIMDIVLYALERNIEVIPEIDMPGSVLTTFVCSCLTQFFFF
jgi:hexosaminidase